MGIGRLRRCVYGSGAACVLFVSFLLGCSRSNDTPKSETPPPPAQSSGPVKASQQDTLVGTWDWGWADVGKEPTMMTTITFEADGQAVVPGVKGKWERAGNSVTVRWDSGAVDTLTLSADGKTLDGHNNAKLPVRGKKR